METSICTYIYICIYIGFLSYPNKHGVYHHSYTHKGVTSTIVIVISPTGPTDVHHFVCVAMARLAMARCGDGGGVAWEGRGQYPH